MENEFCFSSRILPSSISFESFHLVLLSNVTAVQISKYEAKIFWMTSILIRASWQYRRAWEFDITGILKTSNPPLPMEYFDQGLNLAKGCNIQKSSPAQRSFSALWIQWLWYKLKELYSVLICTLLLFFHDRNLGNNCFEWEVNLPDSKGCSFLLWNSKVIKPLPFSNQHLPKLCHYLFAAKRSSKDLKMK